MSRVLHFFPTISRLGGVETILRLHARQDAAFGWESCILVACENEQTSRAHGAMGLGIRGWASTAMLKRRFARAYDAFSPDVFVCNNLWAGRHLLPLAQRSFNVGMLHTSSDEMWIALTNCRNDVDLLIAVSPQIAAKARQIVGEEIPITVIDIPIVPPDPQPRSRVEGAPFVIGYCGRVIIEQKRSDRLAELIEETLKLKANIRFEIMGDGPYEETLRQRFKGRSQVLMVGKKTGDAYWDHLRAWDIIVSTSDYEGTPLSLLEALSQGVIPVFPRINSGGDALTEQIDPGLLFNNDDLAGAAKKLVTLSQSPEADLEPLRFKAMALTSQNRPEEYLRSFFKMIESGLAAAPRRKPSGLLTRTADWRDYVPFFFIRRFMPRWVY